MVEVLLIPNAHMSHDSYGNVAGALGAQLQALRLDRGWNMDRVAAAAGISRTTLFHLERGAIRRPRASTLHKLARALEVPVERLAPRSSPRPAHGTSRRAAESEISDLRSQVPTDAPLGDAARAFDRATNPLVTAVAGDRPELFGGWSADEWDELYSQFGVGGPLTEEGVLTAAERINRHRETIYRLRIVLQTHLAQVADGLIETLYRQVCAGPSAGAAAAAGDDSEDKDPPEASRPDRH